MRKLEERADGKHAVAKKPFEPLGTFKEQSIEKALRFAYDMTFGESGEHRSTRSGGTHRRKNGEKFADTFQGKLAEFAIYNQLYKTHNINEPDLGVWGRGEWDDVDFIIDGKKTAVKSTKAIGDLLLLETKDWTMKGEYIPNIEKDGGLYDCFILVRLEPFPASIIKSAKLYYANEASYETLSGLLKTQNWKYDIPGFITRDELIEAMRQGNIIYQGEKLNGSTRMDAENYYVQSGDMHPINEI